MSPVEPVATSVEVAPGGWRGALDHRDRMLVDRGGLQLRLGRRTGTVPATHLARAEVWRAADAVRRCRLLGADGDQLALLHDQAWRLPEGRLTPLLEGLGCPVTSVDPPAEPQASADQSVAGARAAGVRGGWVVACAVTLLLVASAAPFGGEDPALAAFGSWLRRTTGLLAAALLVLAAAWWWPLARSLPRPAADAVTRPRTGARRGWRDHAGIGRVRDRVTAWDGWDRVATWPAEGPLAPVSVAARDEGATAGAVLLDSGERPLLTLPRTSWAHPEETPVELADRVAAACGLIRAQRGAPAGGEQLDDPEPPRLVVPVVACLGLVVPLVAALAAGLFVGRTLDPQPFVWVPAAVGLTAVLARLAEVLVRRAVAGRGSEHRAVPITVEGVLLSYPLWAGFGFVAVPLLLVRAFPVAVAVGWLTALVPIGVLGLVIAVRRPTALPYRTAVCVVPLACGPIALGLAERLPTFLLVAALVVTALALVVWLGGDRLLRR